MVFSFFRAGLVAGAAVVVFSTAPVLAAAQSQAISSPHSSAPHKVARGAVNRSLTVLYDQSDNDSSVGIVSQNFGDQYDSAAADDFVVPAGSRWTIKEIDVMGAYFNGTLGPADSENVIFYKDTKGKVGKRAIAEFDGVVGKDNFGSFVIKVPNNGLKLKAGHYWMSVVVNMPFDPKGEWSWENQTTQEGDPAMWRNPGDGYGSGCTKWTVESTCVVTPEGDHMFTLRGTSKTK